MAFLRNLVSIFALMIVLVASSLCPVAELGAADARLQVLNFSMDRCEPCKAMQPVLAKLIMEGWPIRQIDIAQEPQLTAQFKLQSAPTIVILSSGREVDRIVGAIAYNKLLARLEAANRAATAGSAGNPSSKLASNNSSTPRPALEQPFAKEPAAPQLLAQRGAQSNNQATNQPLNQAANQALNQPSSLRSFEPSMVRGQSPGPADVPNLNADLDSDSQRMLDFVKDLPPLPKFPPANVAGAAGPANIQLASSTANIGRAAIGSQGQPVQAAFERAQVAAPAAMAPQYDPVSRAQLATVRIRIEDANSIAFGTGTVIHVHNGSALVLTCGHLFREISQDAKMSVDVFDKTGRATNVPAVVVSHSTEQGDIGLMEFRCPYPITPVPISKRAPAIGDAAFSFGCDRGADPTRRDTQIKRINRYIGPANVEIVGAPAVGRSGGALFNVQGQVIGVCNCADAEDDEGIYAALPVIEQHIAAFQLDSLPSDDLPTAAANPVQLASANIGSGSMTPLQTASPTATQVRCVIRDAQGKETAILIDRPSEELVAMLRQSAVK